MKESAERVEVVFDPITKSAMLIRGDKVELLHGPFENTRTARQAALAHIMLLRGSDGEPPEG